MQTQSTYGVRKCILDHPVGPKVADMGQTTFGQSDITVQETMLPLFSSEIAATTRRP